MFNKLSDWFFALLPKKQTSRIVLLIKFFLILLVMMLGLIALANSLGQSKFSDQTNLRRICFLILCFISLFIGYYTVVVGLIMAFDISLYLRRLKKRLKRGLRLKN